MKKMIVMIMNVLWGAYDDGGDDNDCCDDPNVNDCGKGDVDDAYDDNENYCDYDDGNDDVENMIMVMSTKIIIMIMIVVTIMKVILMIVETMVAIIC